MKTERVKLLLKKQEERIKNGFGSGYLEFYPAYRGKTAGGLNCANSLVCIDGWFTSQQLRNIANELDRLEKEMATKAGTK
jgi:hypothetical protein